jgi:hypothetical protein
VGDPQIIGASDARHPKTVFLDFRTDLVEPLLGTFGPIRIFEEAATLPSLSR